MTLQQKNRLPEILLNIQASNAMEGLAFTDEIYALCLAVLNDDKTLDDALTELNAKYVMDR